MKLLQLPGYISGHKSMVGGIRIHFDTNENINTESLALVLGCQNEYGYFIFKRGKEQIEESEIPELPEMVFDENEKTPSKRFRDRLWVFYTQKIDAKGGGFPNWYEDILNKLGQKYLDMLEDE